MVSVTRTAASAIGVVAGLLGALHGYFETLQGHAAPSGLVINAIGPPCQGVFCFPAMTVVPDFFTSGVLTIIFGLIMVAWATALVQRKNGGLVLVLLSIILLLVGGGFFPPAFGIVAGAIGTRIRRV